MPVNLPLEFPRPGHPGSCLSLSLFLYGVFCYGLWVCVMVFSVIICWSVFYGSFKVYRGLRPFLAINMFFLQVALLSKLHFPPIVILRGAIMKGKQYKPGPGFFLMKRKRYYGYFPCEQQNVKQWNLRAKDK